MNRREALSLGLLVSAAGAASIGRSAALGRARVDPVARALHSFIHGYCQAMNAPGLITGIADRNGLMRSSSFGYSDVAAKTPFSPSQLFEIGSITKSFVALLILQLQDAGKIDVQAPIRSYLPWLSMETDFGEILVHHLLTHSSGMPADAPLFPRLPEWRPRQSFAPGAKFHYCNWGYDVLGRLIESVDGRPWAEVLTERILMPLGMRNTVATITSQTRSRIAQSYVALHDDRPYPRYGPLVPAGNLTVVFAAGSIASTADDMALYLQMLLKRGGTNTGRLISEESFALFSTPHIPAPQFGTSATYGYGIVVDQLDNRTRLRHTGGAVSFTSALQADLDSGFGAFASINAELGYRPEPITEYALRLLHAQARREPLPEAPTIDVSGRVVNAADYVGVFSKPDGTQVKIEEGDSRGLILIADGVKGSLQPLGGDVFIADLPEFALFPIVFGRASDNSSVNPAPVTDLSYGSDWYVNPHHQGPGPRPASKVFEQYVGTYYTENPWYDTVRIVQRQGELFMGGDTSLVPTGSRLFRIGRDSSSPEIVEFVDVVEGRANTLRFWGVDMRRIADELR
jgi:CubicO group peptidase (beta-lactamase class C family)